MKLKLLSFKNLCSYGDKLQSFEFSDNPELVLVEGKNGGGKSTISDALTFSIYGKSAIRKVKDLPNRLNKNAYTYIEFITDSNDLVQIERGIDPNFSRLVINEKDHNLPDKRKIDDFIEEQLAKMPFSVFSNTISLSVNDFKSFVKLSAADKRKIIDRIFGLEIVNDMSIKNRENIKNIKSEISSIESAVFANSKSLENSKLQLESMKSDLFKANLDRIAEIKERLKTLNIDLAKYQETFNNFSKVINNLNLELSKIDSIKTSINLKINDIDEKLKLYESNSKCPHCLSELTDDSHSKIKTELSEKRNLLINEFPAIQIKLDKLKKKIKEESEEQNFSKERFYQIKALISPLKQELSNLELEETINDSNQTVYLNNVINSLTESNNQNLLKKEKESQRLKILQELEEALSDRGIKKILMSQVIPTLNEKILRTSKILDFPFSFEFDMNFEPIITQLGISVSPDSLSTGEQKKMNLIVLLSIIELIKLKNSNTNLLFLDEIFSSLDIETTYRVVDLLKTFSTKYKMTIFVISHKQLPEELFDRKLSVSKIDHFSDITIS